MQIIFHTEGTEGNLTSVVALGSALKARGHEVVIMTHAALCDRYSGIGLSFHAVDTAADYTKLMNDAELLNIPSRVPEFFRKHFLPPVAPTVRLIGKLIRDHSRTLLVTLDTPGIAIRIAAELYGVPFATLLTFPGHISVVEAYRVLTEHVLRRDLEVIRGSLGLPTGLSCHRLTPISQLALWPEWFFTAPEGAGNAQFCGFLWNDQRLPRATHDLPPALISRSKVLISGGTGTFAGATFFSQAIGACERAGVPALVLTPYDHLLPRYDPVVIRHARRAESLLPVLRHVRVVIHHGGMNTIGQAIACGVPQLVLARGGDRPFNAGRVQDLGLGISPRLERDRWVGVEQALLQLLRDSAYAGACHRYLRLVSVEESLERCYRALHLQAVGASPE